MDEYLSRWSAATPFYSRKALRALLGTLLLTVSAFFAGQVQAQPAWAGGDISFSVEPHGWWTLRGPRPRRGYRCHTHKEGWALPQILGSSISYRIAVGPQQGRKAFMIRTIRPLDRPDPRLERVARANGFSLHAGVSCEGRQKDKRERLCRYISRPAVAVPRLSLSSKGKVVYTLKTPYRESLPHERSECFGHGTTQVAFEPVDWMTHIPVRHPPGDLWSSKSAVLPICRCPSGRPGTQTPRQPHPLPRCPGAEPPLAWARHARETREGHQVCL